MTTPWNRHERALVLLLRFDGILLLTALFPAVMPFSWMRAVHESLGMGELPGGPLIGYLTRSLSALYAVHGGVELFVSRDIRYYLPVVRFITILGLLFGLWMTGLDIAVGMPLFWILGEGPVIFLLFCVMFWLTAHVEKPG
jgi:hypothetical protein